MDNMDTMTLIAIISALIAFAIVAAGFVAWVDIWLKEIIEAIDTMYYEFDLDDEDDMHVNPSTKQNAVRLNSI